MRDDQGTAKRAQNVRTLDSAVEPPILEDRHLLMKGHSSVAQLNARTDSFIALLLDVSGRARTGDLSGFAPDEAGTMLQMYADAHPELGLVFDGDALVPAPKEAPQPAVASHDATAVAPDLHAAQAVGSSSPVPDSYAVQATPAPDPYATPGSDAPNPYDVPVVYPEEAAPYDAVQDSYGVSAYPVQTPGFGAPDEPWGSSAASPPPAVPEHEMFASQSALEPSMTGVQDQAATIGGHGTIDPGPPAGGSDYGIPMEPGVGGFYGVADQPAPDYTDAANAGEFQGDEVFDQGMGALPPGPGPAYDTPALPGGVKRMAWWWWVLAIVFFPLGGIVGFFLVRKSDPRGARNLLILTGALFALWVLTVAGLIYLGVSLASVVPGAASGP